MAEQFSLNKSEINNLLTNPLKKVLGRIAGTHYTAEIIAPNYQNQIAAHYADVKPDPKDVRFEQFGLKIIFNDAIEIDIYDQDFILLPHLKELISTFGMLLFENTYLSEQQRKDGQKNIFPSLAFHVDRGAKFDNQYSLFVRDPYDVEQKYPRDSGTIILSNQVAKLQGAKEGIAKMDMCSRYDLFTRERVEDCFGKIMAYQGWQAPVDVGEICIFDNRTVLHASYYRGKNGGYKIGVRYLY